MGGCAGPHFESHCPPPCDLAGNSDKRQCRLPLGLEKQKVGTPSAPTPHPAELSFQKHLCISKEKSFYLCTPLRGLRWCLSCLQMSSLSGMHMTLQLQACILLPCSLDGSHPPGSLPPGPRRSVVWPS